MDESEAAFTALINNEASEKERLIMLAATDDEEKRTALQAEANEIAERMTIFYKAQDDSRNFWQAKLTKNDEKIVQFFSECINTCKPAPPTTITPSPPR